MTARINEGREPTSNEGWKKETEDDRDKAGRTEEEGTDRRNERKKLLRME